jgi:tetratricopeptide (TPR) repeat protein
VEHENVVRTHDVDALEVEGQTVHFLVMEYVEGRSLRAMLEDLGAIPEALLREIGRQVASGLAAIHQAGIVHRDLKPENILITDDHQVRIMDLGVARLMDESLALTREGQFAGSLFYAAPEQFDAGEVGPAADLYSLGVMLYELASGENPFRHDRAGQVVNAHRELVPPRLDSLDPEISVFFSVLVGHLLSKEKFQRFGESASHLAEVLEQGEQSEWWSRLEPEILSEIAHVPKVPVRRETEVYGRETELEVLREAWDKAREGRGNVVLVEGEAGIGKTRLVDLFLHELEGEAAHTLYGSYAPSGGIGALSDAILELLGSVGLEDALRPYLLRTASLVPAFAAMVKHESPPVGSVAVQEDALHAIFCHLMRGLAEEKPLLWVVDDLHFSTPDSRRILLSMARALENHAVLLVATTRPGLSDEEQSHFVRLEHFRRLALGRLSPRDVIELLRDAFRSEALAERLGGKIAYKSDGVPFFVFEMIRGLKEGQFLEERPDGTYVESAVIDDIEVPDAIRDLVQARLRDLTGPERALIDVAAVLGFEFESILLGHVIDRNRVAVLQTLAEIERRSGVVRAVGRRYRFDHHQIQEVVYSGLSEELREEYHALVAEALVATEEIQARVPDELPGESAVFLASHHLRGSRPGGALPFLSPALGHLEHIHRHDDALELASRALEVAGLLEGQARADVLLTKAVHLDLLGRRAEERESLDEALALADASADPRIRARVRGRLGGHLWAIAQFEEARDALREAVELAREGGDRNEEATSTGKLGNVCWSQGRYEEALVPYRRCLEIAEEIGDQRVVAMANGSLGLVLMSQGRSEEATEYFERNVALSREIGDPRGEVTAAGNLGLILAELGRYEEARAHQERVLAIAREIGYRRVESSTTGNLGNVFMCLGMPDRALQEFNAHLDLAREIGHRQGETSALSNLGAGFVMLGAPGTAREYLEAGRTVAAEIGDRRSLGHAVEGLGDVSELMGDEDAAREGREEALAQWREMSYARGMSRILLKLGSASARAPEEARPLLEEAVALGEELGSAGPVVLGRCHLALLPGAEPDQALAAMAEQGDGLRQDERMKARFLLFRSTGDAAHLAEAHRLLTHLRDHAPEEYRETMIANVPLHRDITAAWEEGGDEPESAGKWGRL